ncbi:hypothetical protein [Asticcacaulis sp. YBE204]|uniref:hypothetical protein n=1 Tax=Asticcacaulis sp. YBE204 TaxID=1282363 RepID=UPI0003C40FFE|nr:hypothetical protein [Asticcacaulis sp. YBE204]ESQ78471.1 hypothetical protein AEYBE204_13025 [Asticcacaulis sp. YBE204]
MIIDFLGSHIDASRIVSIGEVAIGQSGFSVTFDTGRTFGFGVRDHHPNYQLLLTDPDKYEALKPFNVACRHRNDLAVLVAGLKQIRRPPAPHDFNGRTIDLSQLLKVGNIEVKENLFWRAGKKSLTITRHYWVHLEDEAFPMNHDLEIPKFVDRYTTAHANLIKAWTELHLAPMLADQTGGENV